MDQQPQVLMPLSLRNLGSRNHSPVNSVKTGRVYHHIKDDQAADSDEASRAIGSGYVQYADRFEPDYTT